MLRSRFNKIFTIFILSTVVVSHGRAEEFVKMSDFNVSHFEGAFSVEGDWDLDADVIKQSYSDTLLGQTSEDGPFAALRPTAERVVAPQRFGGFMTLLADGFVKDSHGRPKVIRDIHYPLSVAGRYGIRAFPLVDRASFRPNVQGIQPFDTYPVETRVAGQKILGSMALDVYAQKFLYGEERAQTFVQAQRTTEPNSDAEINAQKALEARFDREQPLFMILANAHPEVWMSPLNTVADEDSYRTQGAFSHMGSYLGFGRTRNSPFNYHGNTWKLENISNTYFVRLRKENLESFEDNWAVNMNLYITSRLLNETMGNVIFPDNYMKDPYKMVTLKEVFSFYRAWFDESYVRADILKGRERTQWEAFKPRIHANQTEGRAALDGFTAAEKTAYRKLTFYHKVREVNEWRTYCAEHITIVLDVGLNLLHNSADYVRIYGPEVGANLWTIVSAKFREIAGFDMPVIPENAFTPLWVSARTNGNQPIANPRDYTGYSKGLPWPAQTNSDVVAAFLTTYVNWADVRALASAQTLQAFLPIFKDRLGIDAGFYAKAITPFITTMLFFDAAYDANSNVLATQASWNDYLTNVVPSVLKKGFSEAQYASVPAEQLDALVDEVRANLVDERKYDSAVRLRARFAGIADLSQRRQEAQKLYNFHIENQLTAKRKVDIIPDEVDPDSRVKFYSPPAIIQRIVNGLHRVNARVDLGMAGTVFNADQLRPSDAPVVQGVRVRDYSVQDGLM